LGGLGESCEIGTALKIFVGPLCGGGERGARGGGISSKNWEGSWAEVKVGKNKIRGKIRRTRLAGGK